MDIVVDDNIVQERILRARRVPDYVRLEALPFSPHFSTATSEHYTLRTIDEEIWETDSLGNFLFDITVGPDANYRC